MPARVRIPLVCGNWKMQKSVRASKELVQHVLAKWQSAPPACEVMVAPSFCALAAVQQQTQGTWLQVAAQNCFWEEKGPFTGEVSPADLAEIGCGYVILGHSERRALGESEEAIAKKVQAVLDANMRPILCMGETQQERAAQTTQKILQQQVQSGLSLVSPAALPKVVVAYEPVWAIGSGQAAAPDVAQEIHGFVREFLQKQHGMVAQQVRIVYGGSVTTAQIPALLAQPDVDGVLVGGASLHAESFVDIVRLCEAA